MPSPEGPSADRTGPDPAGPAPRRPDPSGPGASGPAATPARRSSDAPARLMDLSQVRFLTVNEVAALMRVSRMTVYRLVHAGELASVRVGRSFRVPERAVHAYLDGAFDSTG